MVVKSKPKLSLDTALDALVWLTDARLATASSISYLATAILATLPQEAEPWGPMLFDYLALDSIGFPLYSTVCAQNVADTGCGPDEWDPSKLYVYAWG